MKLKQSRYTLILIMLGVIGIFGSYLHAFSALLTINFLIPAFCILVFTLFLIYYEKTKIIWIWIAILIVFAIITLPNLINGMKYLYNVMVDVYASHDHYVFDKFEFGIDAYGDEINMMRNGIQALTVIFAIYVLVLSILLYHHKGYFLCFLLSIMMFASTIFYQVPPNYFFVLILIVFWMMMLFLSASRKLILPASDSIIKRFMILSLIIGLLFLFLYPKALYDNSIWINNLRTSALELMLPQMLQTPGEVDLKKAGNRFYQHKLQLNVTADTKQTLYLREFSAGIYQDNAWRILSDETYRDTVFNWKSSYLWLDEYHIIDQEFLSNQTYHNIIIEDKRRSPAYTPVPYYLARPYNNMKNQYDSYITSPVSTHEYRTWRQEDFNYIVDDGLGSEYPDFINHYYKDIPSSMKNLFDELNLKQKLMPKQTTTQTVHANIRNYLNTAATYTLTPGNTPEDEDFVRYFLTENKKGYCVHFATTATLLFRYLGIPARYVEGYRVDANQFNRSRVAEVKDDDAHAWVEVFDQRYGWQPYEVTPATRAETTNQQPNQSKTSVAPERDETGKQGNQTTNPAVKDAKNEPSLTASNADKKVPWQILIPIIVVCMVIMIMLRRWLIQRIWQKRMQEEDRKKAVLWCRSYLDQWHAFKTEDTNEILLICDKAQYSLHDISEDEYQYIYHIVTTKTKAFYQSLSIQKKMYIKWFKALL